MFRLPLAIRVAAGLAATAVDEVRSLPSTVASLPITAVSQVLHGYMRTQQQVTALAIRGDELLGFLTPGQEKPEWATFDEDDHPTARPVATGPPARPSSAGRFALYSQVPDDLDTAASARTAPARTKTATKVTPKAGRSKTGEAAEAAPAQAPAPAPIPGYDTMTLAQLRARLRTLSLSELEDLLLHEGAVQARPPFLTMLSNRIATVRSQ